MATTLMIPAPTSDAGATGDDRFSLVGTLVADKYLVERVVGEGGFGIVYRARHQIWDEPVAIKCFTALADAPVDLRQELLDQFIREGKLLINLSSRSAGIVQAHDIGNLTTPTGHWLPYMILEWLDGASLEAWLGHQERRPPARDAHETFRLMDGPAGALAVAHARGIAHRDIKPANFFVLGPELVPGVTIKVLDFGIAKVMQGHTAQALKSTGTQLASFTPGYGAPEQFDRSHGATGPWTDVFQMALVLVEIMRGGLSALDGADFLQLAFASQNAARRPTPRTHGIHTSDAIEAVFQHALAVRAADRFRDMTEFWAALAAALNVVPAPPPAPPPSQRVATHPAAHHVVLEFSRARDAGSPNAFEFSTQTYLLHSPGGGVETAEFPWSAQLLDDLHAAQLPGRAPELIHRIGDILRTFLADAGWSDHERAITAAARNGAPIFLTVRSAAAELYSLPWELVALKSTGQLLGSVPGLLIRYEWPEAPTFPDRTAVERRRGRVLVAWSAAGGAVPADRLVGALRAACIAFPDAFDPRRDVIGHATLAKIDHALDEAARIGPPIDAVHILCHGTAIGATYGLALDDEAAPGTPVAVSADHLQQIFAPHAGMVRMAVLAACDSGNSGKPGNHLGSIAQMIHRAGVQAVVASRFPLSVEGATCFAGALYNALFRDHASLEHAFLTARDALLCDPGQLDWASIQLYSREHDGHATFPLRLPAVPPARAAPASPLVLASPAPHGTTLPTPARPGRHVSPWLVILGVGSVLGLTALGVQMFRDPPPPDRSAEVLPARSPEPPPPIPLDPRAGVLPSHSPDTDPHPSADPQPPPVAVTNATGPEKLPDDPRLAQPRDVHKKPAPPAKDPRTAAKGASRRELIALALRCGQRETLATAMDKLPLTVRLDGATGRGTVATTNTLWRKALACIVEKLEEKKFPRFSGAALEYSESFVLK